MKTARRIAQVLDRPAVRNGIVLGLWLAAAAVVAVRLSILFSNPILPGEPYRGSDGNFLDLRDTIWTPGRFMLEGGNPYDPNTYLTANPWALPFSLYTPAWLLLAAVLALLPYLVSVAVFQALSIGVAIVMLRILCRWGMPTLADVAVPAGLIWMNIWYPGRGAISVQLGSLLAVLGVVLVLRSLTRPETQDAPVERAARPWAALDRACAVGVALALVKAQFGAIVLVALAGRRYREVLCGIIGLALASVPVLIVCTVAAGSPVEFVRSILRDLAVLTSDGAPTGLTFPGQERFELLGILARYGLIDPPLWLEAGVPILALAAVVLVIRLTRNPLAVSAVVSASMLVGYYHGRYDLLLLFVPVVVGFGMMIRGQLRSVAEWIVLVALTLVVLHLHTVSKSLIPGFDLLAQDTVDLVLILAGLTGGMYSAVSARRRRSTGTQLALPDSQLDEEVGDGAQGLRPG